MTATHTYVMKTGIYSHMHVCTHTGFHTDTCTLIQSYMHVHTQGSYRHMHTHTGFHTHTCTHMHVHTQGSYDTCTHMHVHTQGSYDTCTHMHVHTQGSYDTCTHRVRHMHTHARTHTGFIQTHAHTCTYTHRVHTDTCTHSHTCMYTCMYIHTGNVILKSEGFDHCTTILLLRQFKINDFVLWYLEFENF